MPLIGDALRYCFGCANGGRPLASQRMQVKESSWNAFDFCDVTESDAMERGKWSIGAHRSERSNRRKLFLFSVEYIFLHRSMRGTWKKRSKNSTFPILFRLEFPIGVWAERMFSIMRTFWRWNSWNNCGETMEFHRFGPRMLSVVGRSEFTRNDRS